MSFHTYEKLILATWPFRAGSCANDLSVLETESELEKFSTKIQKYFPIHFTYSESCALSKVNCN